MQTEITSHNYAQKKDRDCAISLLVMQDDAGVMKVGTKSVQW